MIRKGFEHNKIFPRQQFKNGLLQRLISWGGRTQNNWALQCQK
jgi:hypothetical protein